MNTFFSINSIRSYLLAGSLLGTGCLGDDHSAVLNPVGPTGPAPIETLSSTNMTAGADGCQYGTVLRTIDRPTRDTSLIAAIQTSCPASFFIEGSCNPLFSYPDGTARRYTRPFLESICFNPEVSMDQGLEACEVGALVCGVSIPGDTTTTTTENGGDGQQTTSTDTVDGPNHIDLSLAFRCCPSQ